MAGGLFEELDLARRWRLLREEMRPVRLPGGQPPGPDAPPPPASEPPEPGAVVPRAVETAAEAAGVVAFYGAVPRCGTSTVACAWALARAEQGAPVVLVDASPDRPTLPLLLEGRVALRGWDVVRPLTPARLGKTLYPTHGVLLLPMTWNRPDPMAPGDLARALPVLVRAAHLRGAIHVGLDLGSFPPLPGGRVDPRLAWAAREADAVAVVAQPDLLALDAAARAVVALKHEAAPFVVLVLVGAGEAEARRIGAMLSALTPPARADAVLPVALDPAVTAAVGVAPVPLRLPPLRPVTRHPVDVAAGG